MPISRKSLLSLPGREWPKTSTYACIALVPTGKKHESGYSIIAIVGFDANDKPVEIAAYCDDISYVFPEGLGTAHPDMSVLRTDMFYPSGIVRVWSREYEFRVGASYSSVDVDIIPKKKEQTPS